MARRPLVVSIWIALILAFVSLVWPPDPYRETEPVISLSVTDRTGELLYEARPDGSGTPVSLEAVPEHVVNAVLAIEDRRFRWHPGIDPLALLRAVFDNLRAAQTVSGASTITMQVARMRRGSDNRSVIQKLSEMHLALRLEIWKTKDQILEEWLSRAYFGRGAYGLAAAARTWFGKAPSDLTISEAAFLAGLPQRPARSMTDALDRRRAVLDAMVRRGRLSADEAQQLDGLALTTQPLSGGPLLGYHLSTALAAGMPDPVKPDAADLPSGRKWVEIRTTLDADLQRRVEALAKGHLDGLSDRNIGQTALIVIENATGRVLAYLGSADPADRQHEGANDGVLMLRQPGSALKPFTYAAALSDRRLTAATVLADIETPFVEAGAAFTAENYDRKYHGPVPVRTALASSYNVPALRVAQGLGVQHLLDRLHAAGFESLNQPASFYGIGLTLGNGEVRLLELARAYAGLARGGVLPEVRAVNHRVDIEGDTLFRAPGERAVRFMDRDVAWIITDILSDPEARSPAFGRGGPLELPFPAAAKTGTSRDYRDNWAIGYTPAHTVAAWAGNFDGSPMRLVGGVTGAGALMHAVLRELGGSGPFVRPATVQAASVCPDSGKRPGPWCPAPRSDWFAGGTEPDEPCDVHRRLEIDTRTGLLADESTPAEARSARLYSVLPAEYYPWMADHSMERPPAHGLEDGTTPSVRFPLDGMVFQMDPVLRSEYQRIRLRAAMPPGLTPLAWVIDGNPVPFVDDAWTLIPGPHEISVQAVDVDGSIREGNSVYIHVLQVDRTKP